MQAKNVVPFVPGGIPALIPFIEQDPAFGAQTKTLSGITRDANGAPLAGCTVKLFRTGDDVLVAQTTSSGVGAFSFTVAGASYYVVAYLAGSPDQAGTTVNTLQGT